MTSPHDVQARATAERRPPGPCAASGFRAEEVSAARPPLSSGAGSRGSSAKAWELALLRIGLFSSTATMTVLALALLGRRLSIPLQPLPAGVLFCTGLLLAGCALGLRRLWYFTGGGRERWPVAECSSSALLLLLAGTLSLPGTGLGGLFLLWFPLVLAEGAGWWRRWQPCGRQPDIPGLPAVSGRSRQRDHSPANAATDEGVIVEQEEPPEDAPASQEDLSVLQRVVRRARDGQDELEGEYLYRFAEGERQGVIHVLFSPAFSGVPELETDCFAAATSVSLKVSQTEVFGARFELRRRGDELPEESVLVAVVARAPLAAGACEAPA
jgi:hypothetical protein